MPTTRSTPTKRRRAVRERAPRPSPALVVEVSLLGAGDDQDARVTFLGRDFRIMRVGANGRVEQAAVLLAKWAGRAQALALTGLPEAQAAGLHQSELAKLEQLVRATVVVPVAHGDRLRAVLQEWAVRHVQAQLP